MILLLTRNQIVYTPSSFVVYASDIIGPVQPDHFYVIISSYFLRPIRLFHFQTDKVTMDKIGITSPAIFRSLIVVKKIFTDPLPMWWCFLFFYLPIWGSSKSSLLAFIALIVGNIMRIITMHSGTEKITIGWFVGPQEPLRDIGQDLPL